jgi:hypothetical protein
VADLLDIDPIADIRALLLADEAVSALVDERVFHSELPAKETADMPRAAIVIAGAGGPGRGKTTHLRRLRIDTICYGAALYESQRVHDAVRNVLENLERAYGSVKSIETNVEGQNARDPVKQWPVCFATYNVLTTIAASA